MVEPTTTPNLDTFVRGCRPSLRILVVGGTGFIGRHTVAELLRRGHDVTLFHRKRSSHPSQNRVQELLGDRLDAASVEKALHGERFDAVLDLAYAWDRGTGPREVSYVVDAVRENLSRYVFLSSCAVYGSGPLPLAEESPRETYWGTYGKDKIDTEDYLLAEDRAGRLRVSILRPPFVYGPYNNIPREMWFWDRILAGRPVIVPDRGDTLTQFAAAKDVAWALAECAANPKAAGQVFNIAEAEPVTHAIFVDRLAAVAGRPVEKAFVPRSRIQELGGNPFGPPMYFGHSLDVGVDFAVDVSKACRLLGFTPTDPIDGLKETFAWYIKEDRGRTPRFSFDRAVLGR